MRANLLAHIAPALDRVGRGVIRADVLRFEEPLLDAVKYLCSKYADDLKIAKHSIFYEHNDVGFGEDDVRPGTYRTAPGLSDCYWARLTKGGDIIDNQFSEYAARGLTVTVHSTDGGFSYRGDDCTFYPTAKP